LKNPFRPAAAVLYDGIQVPCGAVRRTYICV
jgi:hypothetical protein